LRAFHTVVVCCRFSPSTADLLPNVVGHAVPLIARPLDVVGALHGENVQPVDNAGETACP